MISEAHVTLMSTEINSIFDYICVPGAQTQSYVAYCMGQNYEFLFYAKYIYIFFKIRFQIFKYCPITKIIRILRSCSMKIFVP